jgi:hypothetical protein
MEFSKKLTLFLIIFGCCGIVTSYVLAFLENKNINEAVTIALITQVIGSAFSYLIYQFKLKDSRNTNKVDEKGIPYQIQENLEDFSSEIPTNRKQDY